MRILVVDDEPKTAKFLKKGLSEAGFVVDVTANGLDGLQLALEVDFDLIILDECCPAWMAGKFSPACVRQAEPPRSSC